MNIKILFLLFFLNFNSFAQFNEIKILTYNIRYDNPHDNINAWPFRLNKVVSLINQNKPDIICLQEVLHSQLVQLNSVYAKKYLHVGVGRDDGKTKGEYSPIFYNSKRFKLIKNKTHWLSPTPTSVGSKGWDAALPRIATTLVLFDKILKKNILIVNTHFDHEGKEARNQSANYLMNKIKSELTKMPILFCGDLNAEANDSPIQIILKDSTLFDSYNGQATSCCGFDIGSHSKRIDYVFYSSKLEKLSSQIIENNDGKFYPSDHKPVMAIFRLKK